MKVFRGIAIFLPQVLILLVIGGRFDLLFGFNRTEAGFNTLFFLFILVSTINLIWLIVEIIIKKRNIGSYERAGVVSDQEAKEMFFWQKI